MNEQQHETSTSKGALDGLKVLDCTQMLAGPLAATRLGDLGADVIKVEPVGIGEFNRTHGFEDNKIEGEMTTFLAVNRNKRSLAIDLKAPGSAEAFHTLVAGADVFLQNFTPVWPSAWESATSSLPRSTSAMRSLSWSASSM